MLCRSSLALCLLLVLYYDLGPSEVYGVPTPEAKVTKLGRKKTSRRVQILPDPAEALEIPDISELNAEVRFTLQRKVNK